MKTEHELAKVLKEMMASRSLDDISVMEISRRCGVSRKTFYYHYHDIYDLLTLIFLLFSDSSYQSGNITINVYLNGEKVGVK